MTVSLTPRAPSIPIHAIAWSPASPKAVGTVQEPEIEVKGPPTMLYPDHAPDCSANRPEMAFARAENPLTVIVVFPGLMQRSTPITLSGREYSPGSVSTIPGG